MWKYLRVFIVNFKKLNYKLNIKQIGNLNRETSAFSHFVHIQLV